jgi:hypothetical protein
MTSGNSSDFIVGTLYLVLPVQLGQPCDRIDFPIDSETLHHDQAKVVSFQMLFKAS